MGEFLPGKSELGERSGATDSEDDGAAQCGKRSQLVYGTVSGGLLRASTTINSTK